MKCFVFLVLSLLVTQAVLPLVVQASSQDLLSNGHVVPVGACFLVGHFAKGVGKEEAMRNFGSVLSSQWMVPLPFHRL